MIMYLHLMKAISKLANGIQLLFEFSLVQVCNHLREAVKNYLADFVREWGKGHFSENDLFLTLGLGTSSAQNQNLRPLQ